MTSAREKHARSLHVCTHKFCKFVWRKFVCAGRGGRDVCIRTCTYIQPKVSCSASVGLTQAHPNNRIFFIGIHVGSSYVHFFGREERDMVHVRMYREMRCDWLVTNQIRWSQSGSDWRGSGEGSGWCRGRGKRNAGERTLRCPGTFWSSLSASCSTCAQSSHEPATVQHKHSTPIMDDYII